MTTTYSLRNRIDGQIEVLEHKAAVIGTFARPEHARQFYDWLAGHHVTVKAAPPPEVLPATIPNAPAHQRAKPEPPPPGRAFCDDAPVSYAIASDVQKPGPEALAADAEPPVPLAQQGEAGKTQVQRAIDVISACRDEHKAKPASQALTVVEQPSAPVVAMAPLNDAALQSAFERLEAGEKLQLVAAEIGVRWPSLRGSYASYKRQRQAQIARAGQDTCRLCGKAFMPSLTSPDACARCAKTMER